MERNKFHSRFIKKKETSLITIFFLYYSFVFVPPPPSVHSNAENAFVCRQLISISFVTIQSGDPAVHAILQHQLRECIDDPNINLFCL